jgi:hypothetical protein
MVLAFALLSCFSVTAAASDLISGAVENKSRNQAASGDPVILLRLDQGMQEEARTTTDELGAFTLKVQVPDKPHLVRILHQGVNYDRQASPGDSLTIEVFDAGPKVQAISGGIEIIRTGTNGNMLHVSDMMEIRNDSTPPITQASERTFDVYLPAAAKIDSVMAATSGKIGVLITASPVRGDPGHYTVNFPLRPGSTKFAFNYDIPYSGHAAFHTRLAYPMQQLAVMFPPTMKFASRSSAFQPLATGNKDYQVQAANLLKAGDGPSFEISGAGPVPRLQARTQPPGGSRAAAPAPAFPAVNNPGPPPPAKSNARSAPPAVAPSPPVNEWWIVGAAAVLVLGACAFLIWRRSGRSALGAETKPKASVTKADPAGTSSSSLLDALKEQMLELETGRLNGSISREEYDAAKRTLEGTVKRALTRSAAK